MQLRIYILFNRSKTVRFWYSNAHLGSLTFFVFRFEIAFVNGVLFIISIGVFLWILIANVLHPHPHVPLGNIPLSSAIPDNLPPPPKDTCPSTTGGPRWAQWVPRAYQQTKHLSTILLNPLRVSQQRSLSLSYSGWRCTKP